MKFSIVSLFVVFFGIQVTALAQTPDYANMKPHPRLIIDKNTTSLIKQSLERNPDLLKVHRIILDYSDDVINAPVSERIKEGKRLLTVSRTVLKRVFYLAYSYKMTGNKKYVERAEQEMLAASAFSDWNPTHFLDVGEMVMALAIGYDWLFDELKPSTRKIVREAIVEKGFLPSRDKKHAWFLNVDHNWNQVCNAGLLFGALAIYEDEKEIASEMIERSLKTIVQPLRSYGPDGNYAEGYGYWGYGTSFQVLYLAALESAFGTDFNLSQTPGFLQTAKFMLFMTGTTGKPFNFSDAENGSHANPMMYWFAQKTDDPSLLWVEKDYLKKQKPAFAEERLLPSLLLFSSKLNFKDITKPKLNYWSGRGHTPVIFVRTQWEDPNGIYLGFKGGSGSVSHAHLDAGSFVFDAQGVRWALDLGMQQYYSLEKEGVDLWNMAQNSQRWQVFRYNNYVHNTLTVNGKLHDVKAFAAVTQTTNTREKKGGRVDLSEVLRGELKKAVREINVIEDRYLEVIDEIETGSEPALIRWSMVTPAESRVVNNHTFELKKGGKTLLLVVEGPENVSLKTWSTTPRNHYDAPNPGTQVVGFETSLESNAKVLLKVKLIPQS